MGLKKLVKKAVKQVVGGVKTFVKDPLSKEGLEAGVGIAMSPATGGASLSLTEDAGRRTEKKAVAEEAKQQAQAALVAENKSKYGYESLAELAEARRKKQKQIEQREGTRVTGLSGLIGSGTTLG